MLSGFKDFLFRGEVLELAIPVVMGTAFSTLMTSVVTNLVNPVISARSGTC